MNALRRGPVPAKDRKDAAVCCGRICEEDAVLDEDRTPRAPLLAFRSVSLSFGDNEILRDINLTIGEGEVVCVVGPSRCGKTTLLRLIAGLISRKHLVNAPIDLNTFIVAYPVD